MTPPQDRDDPSAIPQLATLAEMLATYASTHALPAPDLDQGLAADGCPVCGGAGWVGLSVDPTHVAFGRSVRCPCMAPYDRARRFRRVRRMGDLTPEQAARMTFATWDARRFPEAVAHLRRWPQDTPPWVVLAGPQGTGKTHLLSAAAVALQEAGQVSAVYCVVPSLMRYLRRGFDDGSYTTRLEYLETVDALILDDLGAQNQTDWADEQLYMMLDERYRRERPTAIASNLHPDDWEPRLGSRAQDARISTLLIMAMANGNREAADYRKIATPAVPAARAATGTRASAKGATDGRRR